MSTDRRAVTHMNGLNDADAGLRTIFVPFQAKGVLYSWGLVQPANGPLHKLPPARLVIQQQTLAYEQRKGTREGSIGVGHFSVLMHPASLAVDNGQAPHLRRAPQGG